MYRYRFQFCLKDSITTEFSITVLNLFTGPVYSIEYCASVKEVKQIYKVMIVTLDSAVITKRSALKNPRHKKVGS